MAALQGDGWVLEKLKRHEEFAHKSDEELLELAHELTDFDKLFRRFNHLLEPVVDKAIDEALIDYRAVSTHSREVETAHNISLQVNDSLLGIAEMRFIVWFDS